MRQNCSYSTVRVRMFRQNRHHCVNIEPTRRHERDFLDINSRRIRHPPLDTGGTMHVTEGTMNPSERASDSAQQSLATNLIPRRQSGNCPLVRGEYGIELLENLIELCAQVPQAGEKGGVLIQRPLRRLRSFIRGLLLLVADAITHALLRRIATPSDKRLLCRIAS